MVVKTMPRLLWILISSPLKSHLKATGRSPLLITQETDAVSPSFRISSPNSNGVICGGTNKINTLLKSGLGGVWNYLTQKEKAASRLDRYH